MSDHETDDLISARASAQYRDLKGELGQVGVRLDMLEKRVGDNQRTIMGKLNDLERSVGARLDAVDSKLDAMTKLLVQIAAAQGIKPVD